MNRRDSVCNPIVLSPDEPGMPRFQFVALDAYTPRGDVTHVEDGINLHSFPWFAEIVGRYSDRQGQPIDTWWCINRMPVVGTDFELLAACINDAPESLFQVRSGRDYGDALADILRRDWADIYSMFEASTSGDLSRRLLLAVDVGDSRQWMVADVVAGEARHDIAPAQVEDLIVTALSVAVRTFDWFTKLPGTLELGPDLTTRRLRGLAGLIGGVADVGGGLQGLAQNNLTPQALTSAIQAASGLPDHVRSVFR
ncbi:hypothetical protein SAMN05428985_104219 [Nocardioides sp. YR527]|uniref:hypothetical protein n=1 Tax=Nocardioides sp. YR527 TaxID=1881028 RepID=UPI00088A7D8B|nr:hypothetical protein [Nocardioides sp. YR527]SDK49000.1 hypothetical protein SAMN05428985_104219 [Nocardioides sp. YR527]